MNTPGCSDIALDTILIHPDVEMSLNTASGLCSPVNIDTTLLQISINQNATSHWTWITDTSVIHCTQGVLLFISLPMQGYGFCNL